MRVAKNARQSARFRSTMFLLVGLLSLFLLLPFALILTVAGASWVFGVPLAIGLGLLLIGWWIRGASGRVASQLGLDPTRLCTDPGLSNLVEGLSLLTGTDEPVLYIADDPALNACPHVGQDGASILVTSGLLYGLGRMEQEGIVAELLVGIKSGKAEFDTMAAGTVGSLFFDGPLSFLGPTLGTWAMRRLVQDDGDVAADRAAVGVTRYPPGLSSALKKMSESYHPALATAGNDHLWIAPPLSTEAAVPHSPLAWRIDILLEL